MISELFIFALCATSVAGQALNFIQLKGSSGDYVTAYWPDGAVRVDSVPYTHASTFELHEIEKDEWQLRAVKNNNYLTAENGGGQECIANRPSASGWETFRVTHVSDSQVQLQSFDNHWLTVGSANASFQLLATATSASTAETFTVVNVPQQRSVNLGSWFVPEKWMFTDSSDLWKDTQATDLYTLSVELGPEEASNRMHKHWESWFTEADFEAMANTYGVNQIRIPMGYWDMEETAPYVFGGMAYIDQAVEWADKYGMSVLIDLHGCPGSQNGQDHSGKSGEILWSEPENVAKTVEILGMMAARWASVSNVWGFELMNEPHYSLSYELLTEFYRDAYTAIREYSDSTHIVINSLYGPHDWTANVFPEPQYRNAVLDLHMYTVWTGASSIEEIVDITASWGQEIRDLTVYYPVIVGEMSLGSSLGDQYTSEMRQMQADGQMTSFQQNALGYYFWGEKLDYFSEDWAFVDGFSYVKAYYL
mmetsp:Transcript_36730/g.68332  ORF Transcript_36730/g.68332 Transcript_36730/m.68332 type:complete len:479 (-) Transcript_36730:167-1603(-)